MKKICVLMLALVLLVGFAVCFAEDDPMAMFRKQQEEYLKMLQQDSPKLYEFEKRLMDIQNQMQQIMMDLQQGKITKERAKGMVTPLIREEIEIRNNPEYMVEQRVSMILNMSQQMPQGKQGRPQGR